MFTVSAVEAAAIRTAFEGGAGRDRPGSGVVPPSAVAACTSARHLFHALGRDAAKAAFLMALDLAPDGDDAGETRWLAIAIEVMALQRQRGDTMMHFAGLTARGAAAVR